jgi:hypothetical protein
MVNGCAARHDANALARLLAFRRLEAAAILD